MNRSIKALAVSAPLLAVTCWYCRSEINNRVESGDAWAEPSEADNWEHRGLRPLPEVLLIAPGTFDSLAPVSQREGDFIFETVPESDQVIDVESEFAGPR